jgi:L-ascorbate metabolism protein UlaG (beta-lactamase superfamily)
LGSHERVTVNGITVDALPVAHSPHPQEDGSMVPDTGKHLAFVVNLAGARFFHVGDAWIGDSDTTAHINAYPFEEAPIRVLFMNFFCRTPADQDVIARKIKPEHIVAMHIAPEELEREAENVRAVYPDAVVFAGSMERRVFK